jgi:hypothetical protein
LLGRIYPDILRALLDFMGSKNLYEESSENSDQPAACKIVNATPAREQIYSEKFFTINLRFDSPMTSQFNQRQLWFLESLRMGRHVHAQDIVGEWKVTLRTARSDIGCLVKAKKIRFVGTRKTGRYKVK